MVPTDLPFTFKRLQFPVRLAFAMTINKAQGQSLRVAGLNLGSPCFSHGQLYVACSRVGTPKTLRKWRSSKNVIYLENFKRLRRLCKNDISTAYASYMDRIEQSLHSDPKEVFKYLHMKQGTTRIPGRMYDNV
ncbi:uncharacterized protein LOC135136038 [Zophobas morio]|uniref:uncharacterized protein LOC135136038 n=1 Tax=Zophobas morio TaxID=2755281 RepID=UPI0030832A46